MHNVFYEISNPPSAIFNLIFSVKFISYNSIILSFVSDLFFKYIYDDGDFSIFAFTLYLMKINTIFCFVLDLILAATHTNNEFSIRYLIYVFLNKLAKSFLLYPLTEKQYLLAISIFPMLILESLHSYVSISKNSAVIIKLRCLAFYALLPLEFLGEAICIHKLEHHSTYFIFFMYLYLLMFAIIEFVDHFTVSERISKDYLIYKLIEYKEAEKLIIKKDQ